jgi:hypothetical protein
MLKLDLKEIWFGSFEQLCTGLVLAVGVLGERRKFDLISCRDVFNSLIVIRLLQSGVVFFVVSCQISNRIEDKLLREGWMQW